MKVKKERINKRKFIQLNAPTSIFICVNRKKNDNFKDNCILAIEREGRGINMLYTRSHKQEF